MKKSQNLSEKLTQLQERLQKSHGKKYWRSLEELAGSQEFQELVHNEFSSSPLEWGQSVSRRNFLKFMGASMALAGITSCTRQPLEKIHPYVDAPEDVVPGKPLYFATAFVQGGLATGVLVESHEGHPTKVEGNPQHSASLGATDIFAQASILDLYDPERSKVVKHRARISTWDKFISDLKTQLESQQIKDGAGIRLLTETVTSPSVAGRIQAVLKRFPLARWHQFEPVSRDHVKRGSKMAFGEIYETRYDLEKADVILSLDADFLTSTPGHLLYTRQFSARRKNLDNLNRLYALESVPTLTGAMADHRLAVRASEIIHFAVAIAREFGVVQQMGLSISGATRTFTEKENAWIKAVAKDLKKHRGTSLVITGETQAPEVHALAHILNSALNNVGKTVLYTESVEAQPVIQSESLAQLVHDMQEGAVDLLVIFGGNPVFSAPADLDFKAALQKVEFAVHLAEAEDETSLYCHWHIPQQHYLESWGDARAFDGTVTFQQPLIAPLYGSKSIYDILACFTDDSGKSSLDLVKAYWKSATKAADFEAFWQRSLHDGFIAGSAFPVKKVTLNVESRRFNADAENPALEINFRPDPHLYDGRYINNGWLQELPKPLTKLTWDNAALMSPATARSLDVNNGDVVELTNGSAKVKLPVWIWPGHAENAVTVHFGYGREVCGRVGAKTGVNVYPLRASGSLWMARNVSVVKTGETYVLASTQEHSSMENRHLVRAADVEEYREHPHVFHEMGEEPAPDMSLYPKWEYNDYAWGMVIDLNVCIGCNACTIACQSENNIPVVGREEVLNGREMHWIRVDRYFEGTPDEPDTYHQPVPCMHCEDAPCEVVCPVGATTHSPEGLNEMVYNRCVGTRYCSNNCPYKVRRFNFYKYADYDTDVLKLLRNPDVTVRSRGVMEKCTYCVQRINHARIDAEKEGRTVRDGEIVTACQQVCPADAIVFGNINEKGSRVSELKSDPRNYGILAELGTRPRTTYLAKIKNPNPEIEQV